jgi:hypothetical protein
MPCQSIDVAPATLLNARRIPKPLYIEQGGIYRERKVGYNNMRMMHLKYRNAFLTRQPDLVTILKHAIA